LPSPADIVARLSEDKDKPAAAPPPSASAPSNGGANAIADTPAPVGGGDASSALPAPSAAPATMAAVAPQIQPSPQAVEESEPDPDSFRDLIALFAEKREIQIRNHLYMNVHPIAYEPGRLEFRPNASAPGNLAGEVLNCLRQWRGAHWSVSVSRDAGEPTLAEQDSTHEQAERAAAAQDPVVRAALETFTGARIERVTSRDGVAAGLASDDSGFEDPIDDDFDGEDSDL